MYDFCRARHKLLHGGGGVFHGQDRHPQLAGLRRIKRKRLNAAVPVALQNQLREDAVPQPLFHQGDNGIVVGGGKSDLRLDILVSENLLDLLIEVLRQGDEGGLVKLRDGKALPGPGPPDGSTAIS